jgi:formylglycine-generating enzyme required for sulfatase activity
MKRTDTPSDTRPRGGDSRSTDRLGRKTSASGSAFEKVLQAYETGGFTYNNVLARLKLLLTIGASPTELSEILRRRELVERLPEHAHAEILNVLNEAIARAAAEAAAAEAAAAEAAAAEAAAASEAQVATPDVAAVPFPDSDPGKETAASIATVALREAVLTEPVPATATEAAGPRPTGAPASPVAATSVRLETLFAERLRTLEQRITRKNADFEALTHSYERTRDSERTAVARGAALAEELAAARTLLESEQNRIQEVDRIESRSLRDLLAERDAHIAELQTKQADMARALEERERAGAQLEQALLAARSRADAIALELKASQDAAAKLNAQLANSASRLNAARTELGAANAQSLSYLESLRTREWRRGFDHNLVYEADSRLDAAHVEGNAVQAQREQLQAEVASLKSKLDTQTALLDKVRAASGADARRMAELQAEVQRQDSEHSVNLTQVRAQHVAQMTQLRSAQEAQPAKAESVPSVQRVQSAQPAPLPQPVQSVQAQPARAAAAAEAAPRQRELSPAAAMLSAPKPATAGPGRLRIPAAIARRIAWASAAVCVLAAVTWAFSHKAPVPVPPPPPAPVAALPSPGTVIHDCPACPAMTVLPAGRFKQGSAPGESDSTAFDKPLHWVSIDRSLAMATNAITVDDFQQFVAATGRDMQGCDTYDDGWKHRPKSSWKDPGFTQTGTHPVTCVSWNDAAAYATWMSAKTGHKYRLPSASEWEYAARAGTEPAQPWTSGSADACANANVADQSAARRYPGWTVFACNDSYVYTAPVGSFNANAFGLNDMLGNVFQWTEDCWNADYAKAPIDGSARSDGNCSEHELRGGSWFSTPAYVRAGYRNHFAADYRTSTVGIRLVRELTR